jgi:hypothetical protein
MIRLRDDEHMIAIIRKHWFDLVAKTVGLAILLVTPYLIYAAFQVAISQNTDLSTQLIGAQGLQFPLPLAIFLGSLWGLVMWTRFFSVWTDHYLDVWVLTNRRLIDIDQIGFFNRRMASFRLERIQDITIRVEGFISTLLNYGDIHVQTAGEDQQFIIKSIPRPKDVKQAVLDQFDVVMERSESTADSVSAEYTQKTQSSNTA